MKKLILIISAVAISHSFALSQACQTDTATAKVRQGCLPSGIAFSTQQQIDNFPVNYPGCTVILGSATIGGADIVNLSGLSELTAVNGTLSISYNPLLVSLQGLGMLDSVGNTLLIGTNTSLEGLSELHSLKYVGYDFKIGNNPALTSVATGGQLDAVYAELQIIGNQSLTSLSGFDCLQSVGLLTIRGNSMLTSLAGLDQIDGSSMVGLTISDNPNLSTCDVRSVCDFIGSHPDEANILNNAPGCNDPEEVEAACGEVSTENISLEDTFLLFPNPANKTVTISGNNILAMREIMIYNQTGQKVHQGKPVNNTLDISKLRPGMYVVEMVTNHGNLRKKLIVQ
ncbi:MAG: T9SS type A sorting domain-containing protein [Bacteroidales bacterium]|nr:T9SS type A sorting domain-containing protein [Bacteroidales bacterium]